MKKTFLLTVIILFTSLALFSQTWGGSTTTTGNTYRTGNVGIGISNPETPLHIYGSGGTAATIKLQYGSNNSSLSQNSSGGVLNLYNSSNQSNSLLRGYGDTYLNAVIGNVGIGITSPSEKLHVNGGKLKVSNGGDEIIIDPHYYVGGDIGYKQYIISDALFGLTFWDPTPGQYNGYVDLIAGSILCKNTTNDSYTSVHDRGITMREHSSDIRASVYINTNGNATFSGKVTCKEIEVKPDVWSDFVFNKDYNLRPIQEVRQYIHENKHLPDVPSQKEVKENGVNLGEMDAILLQKIEELTLYTIQQQKLIEAQNERLVELEKKLVEK